MWKRLLAVVVVAACGTDSEPTERTFTFGPFPLAPGQEVTDQCVSVTLHNAEPLYINTIDLVGAPGIHHSNWFYVPEHEPFVGPDGAWPCSQYHYDQGAAAIFGGVLFAQSTQNTHETQAFAEGAAIRIPAHSTIVANVHLLNAGDGALSVPLSLTIHPIAIASTLLTGIAIENQAIAIPPQAQSKFTVECDFSQKLAQLGTTPFRFFHALPHYHALGTGMTVEAIRDSDGTADTVWTTSTRIGDSLGGMLDPPFDMTGHSKLRMSCSFDNPRADTVHWGNGDQEMCIFFGFTDSTFVWDAGVLGGGDPGPSTSVNGEIEFTAPACSVFATDGQR